MIAASLVLVITWGASVAYLSGRWLASAPYRAAVAQARFDRRAAERAERDRQAAQREYGEALAANNAANPTGVEALPSNETALAASELEVRSSAPARTPPVTVQPRWIVEPEVRVPVNQIPDGGARLSFSCTLTTDGRLTGCRGQGPAPLLSLIEPRLAEARLTPFTVDGRPEATRYSFSYSLSPPSPSLRPPAPARPPASSNTSVPDDRSQLPGSLEPKPKPAPRLPSAPSPAEHAAEPAGSDAPGQAVSPPAS